MPDENGIVLSEAEADAASEIRADTARKARTTSANSTFDPSRFEPSESRARIPQLTLDSAYHALDFYQRKPQYLANPRTKHAAQEHFNAAAKIVEMSIQLERVNAAADTARLRTDFTKQKFDDLSKVTPFIPADDVEGQAELGRLNGMVGRPDFDLQSFSTGVARLQSKYKKPAAEFAPTELQRHWNEYKAAVEAGNRDLAEAQWRVIQSYKSDKTERPVTVTEKNLVTGLETTRRLTEDEAATLQARREAEAASRPVIPTPEEQKLLKTYAEDKAALAGGAPSAGIFTNRKQRMEEARTKLAQRGIDADTGSRLQAAKPAPTAAPATNGPSQSDIDYLRNNPGVRDLFEKRFGTNSAAPYLK